MNHATYLRRCLPLVLLLAACPAGKGNTADESTADTGDTTATATTTASDTTDVTSSATDPTTGGCAPIPCDQCGDGCIGQQVCIGSQASCECDCEDPSTTSPGDSTSGTEATGTSGSTSSTSSTGGEPAIVCGGDMPSFPEFDRSCAVAMDCALVLHQIDCCGSLAALGISADAARLFAEAEAVCAMQYPQCDCLAKPTVADDGNSSPDNNAIAVSCVDGECRSFVP
jgi:hypothetical protein